MNVVRLRFLRDHYKTERTSGSATVAVFQHAACLLEAYTTPPIRRLRLHALFVGFVMTGMVLCC